MPGGGVVSEAWTDLLKAMRRLDALHAKSRGKEHRGDARAELNLLSEAVHKRGIPLWKTIADVCYERVKHLKRRLDHSPPIADLTGYVYTKAEVEHAVRLAALEHLQGETAEAWRELPAAKIRRIAYLAGLELQRRAAEGGAPIPPEDVDDVRWSCMFEGLTVAKQRATTRAGVLSYAFPGGGEMVFVSHPDGCDRWRGAKATDAEIGGPHFHQAVSEDVAHGAAHAAGRWHPPERKAHAEALKPRPGSPEAWALGRREQAEARKAERAKARADLEATRRQIEAEEAQKAKASWDAPGRACEKPEHGTCSNAECGICTRVEAPSVDPIGPAARTQWGEASPGVLVGLVRAHQQAEPEALAKLAGVPLAELLEAEAGARELSPEQLSLLAQFGLGLERDAFASVARAPDPQPAESGDDGDDW